LPESSPTTIRKAALHIRIVGFSDYRKYLANIYRFIKKRNPSYSYEKFSIELGLGKSNASRQIINEVRNLSTAHAADLAKNLGLRGYRATYLLTMVDYENTRDPAERDAIFLRLMQIKSKIEPKSLDDEQIQYFNSWLHPIIRELSYARTFVGSPEWIQKHLRFPVRKNEINNALATLTDIGFLVFNRATGFYERREAAAPEMKVDDLAAVRYLQQMIDCGKEAMTRIQSKDRAVSGCTAMLSKESFQIITEKLKEILTEMERLESSDRTREGVDVYQVNFQAFPFTEIK
jgi:uncharacterized protein (TIGR02147 family)